MMKKVLLLVLVSLLSFVVSGCGSSKLSEVTGMNSSQEKAAIKIFNDNGITELKDIEKSEQRENLFIIKNDKFGTVFFDLGSDKSVEKIVYETKLIYANGKAINKFSDLIVSDEERINYKNIARSAIKDNLKAPSSAKFDARPLITRNKDVVLISGNVDAQNSFGAMIRSSYNVKLQLPDKKILEVHIK